MKIDLGSLIENKLLPLEKNQSYAAILGLTPSKGARSPTLWNRAFQGLNSSARMFPMDVQEKNLPALVSFLKQDPSFLGGAITMPFKTQILPLLDAIEPEAKDAGAVNCIFKQKGQLIGTNTDGLAARMTIEEAFGRSLEGSKVLLIGLGGAGSAIAAYMGAALGKKGYLTLANRTPSSMASIQARLVDRCQVKTIASWPVPVELERFDIIINATSIGFETPRQDERGWFMPKFFTPIGPSPETYRSPTKEEVEKRYVRGAEREISANIVRCLEFFEHQKEAFVYDAIYQPLETMFLSMARLSGCKIKNGLAMNLEQAVIAFDKTTEAAGMRATNRTEVRRFMESN